LEFPVARPAALALGKKYRRSAMGICRQLQCKALRERRKKPLGARTMGTMKRTMGNNEKNNANSNGNNADRSAIPA
jgi:hypothetical protein